MDVVWMAKLRTVKILKNNKGQSVVEYILLLSVIVSISYIIYHNRRFQAFARGDAGFFASMKKGISYSYRYGRDVNTASNYDNQMNFEYQSSGHDTYFNSQEGQSRFFMGLKEYKN